MSRFATQPAEPRRIAVVHKAGRTWRVLVALRNGGAPTLLAAREFTEPHQIEPFLETEGAERVIAVLPASSVVCRTCTLPNAEDAQLEQALTLQADVYLQADGAGHRTAMAVLPAAPEETSRSGLIISWPNRDGQLPPEAPPTSRPITFAADLAGLAALLGEARPAEPLIWIDRRVDAIGLAMAHSNGAVLRGTRERAASEEEWIRRVASLVAETALGVGHSAHYAETVTGVLRTSLAGVDRGEAMLFAPPELLSTVAARFESTPVDPSWWRTFGIAAGVLLASAGPLADLTTLQAVADVETPSPLSRFVDRFSRPGTAVKTAVVCGLILLVAPLLLAGLRLGLLKMRYPDLDAQVATLAQARSQLAVYEALDTQAMSMTKVLSDIATNTPEGIELEVIRVQQADRGFSVGGEARPHEGKKATEVVAMMQQYLQESRLFDEIQLDWGDRNNYGHYKFDLSGKIARPHWAPKYDVARDFRAWTLSQRQGGRDPGDDGEGEFIAVPDDPGPESVAAASTPPPDMDDMPDDTPRPPRSTRGGPGSGPRAGAQEFSRDRGAGGAVDPTAVPEALTSEQIAAMSIEEVNSHLPKVATARGRARRAGDTELAERLKQEFDMLMARKREPR